MEMDSQRFNLLYNFLETDEYRVTRSHFASEITIAHDLIACHHASAAANTTNYSLSNFDRDEFDKKKALLRTELNNRLHVNLFATHWKTFSQLNMTNKIKSLKIHRIFNYLSIEENLH